MTDSVSSGVVSGLNRSAATDTGPRTGLIQFDAAVNPGSSGGPLLDSRGMVVGIVVALADPSGRDAFAGIGFAVPIGEALGGSGQNGPWWSSTTGSSATRTVAGSIGCWAGSASSGRPRMSASDTSPIPVTSAR